MSPTFLIANSEIFFQEDQKIVLAGVFSKAKKWVDRAQTTKGFGFQKKPQEKNFGTIKLVESQWLFRSVNGRYVSQISLPLQHFQHREILETACPSEPKMVRHWIRTSKSAYTYM